MSLKEYYFGRKDTFLSNTARDSVRLPDAEFFPEIFPDLTHFQPIFHSYTSWNYQKISSFLFSEGVEVEHWLKIG